MSLSTQEILDSYAKRWSIELFFRQSKQKLGLDKYQIRSSQGIQRYWLIMSLTHYLCCMFKGKYCTFEEGYFYLQKQLKGSNIEIVGVAVDKSVAGIPKFLARHKMSEFNTWSDPTESIEDVMPLEVVPTNYIIDGAGNIVGYLPGYLPWDDKDVMPFLKKLAEKYAKPKAN